MKKYRQGDYIPLGFDSGSWLRSSLWSATDIKTGVSSWFAIDQIYFAVFNLNLKCHELTTREGTKWYRIMFLTSVLGGESCLKSNWSADENQKANPTSPQSPGYIGQKPQTPQPKKYIFFSSSVVWFACWDHLGIFHIISLLPLQMSEK